MEAKQCAWCNALIKGRTDKKFCNDYCRSSFHYKARDQKPELVKQIIRQLERNWLLLGEWGLIGISEIDLKHARMQGFVEDCFTGIETRSKKRWRLVFDRAFVSEKGRVVFRTGLVGMEKKESRGDKKEGERKGA